MYHLLSQKEFLVLEQFWQYLFRFRNNTIDRISVSQKKHNFTFFLLTWKSSQQNVIPLILSKLCSVLSAIRGRMNRILFFSIWNQNRPLKPATHLAILYADRGEFDHQRTSPPIEADTPGDIFRRSRRCGTSTLFPGSIERHFEKS